MPHPGLCCRRMRCPWGYGDRGFVLHLLLLMMMRQRHQAPVGSSPSSPPVPEAPAIRLRPLHLKRLSRLLISTLLPLLLLLLVPLVPSLLLLLLPLLLPPLLLLLPLLLSLPVVPLSNTPYLAARPRHRCHRRHGGQSRCCRRRHRGLPRRRLLPLPSAAIHPLRPVATQTDLVVPQRSSRVQSGPRPRLPGGHRRR